MAAVPFMFSGVLYPKGKSGDDKPIPCVIIGNAWNPDLSVGGGPIKPPGIEIPPDYGIWPNPPEGQAPLPSHPIALPGDPWWPTTPPPEEIPSPPAAVAKPGWNWAPGWSQWIWVYVPGAGQAQPKK